MQFLTMVAMSRVTQRGAFWMTLNGVRDICKMIFYGILNKDIHCLLVGRNSDWFM